MLKSLLIKLHIFPLIKRWLLFKRSGKRIFTNRSSGADTVILVLTGYKPFLWKVVFERIKAFAPQNADVCLVSSGIYSSDLEAIATKYNWSYLSTKRNNVCVALNVAIDSFPQAQYIYKMDEDIFVTKHCFSHTLNAYLTTKEKNSFFKDPLFVAPLIPINGFTYALILKYLHLEEEYSSQFEPVHIGGVNCITTNPDAAKFMWGGGGVIFLKSTNWMKYAPKTVMALSLVLSIFQLAFS